MGDQYSTARDRGVLRWGGLAGILGSVILIIVFVIVAVFVGAEPAGLAGPVSRYPEIRIARTVEDGLYLLVQALWVAHFLALYVALRATALAPALFGSVVGILGLLILAASALPHVAQAPISDLYHATGATPADQATLALIWQATQGINDELLVSGLFVLPLGVLLLGAAMLRSPALGKGFGWMSVVLGALGTAAACVLLFSPRSSISVAGVFALIVFNLVLGWKTYRLSKAA